VGVGGEEVIGEEEAEGRLEKGEGGREGGRKG
jgi:hypothetical protein